MLRCCQDAMRKACADSAQLHEFTGEDDHVHLMVDYPPKAAIPALVNPLKGMPARRLRIGVHRSREQAHHAQEPLVVVLLRRVLRGRAARHHPPVHPAANSAG
jgi:REP element-mobilizing transposase RayT